MNPNDSILIADIIRYAYSCHNYEAAAPIIHLLDKYCGTTDHALEIDELKQYFKTLHYGAGMTCATCASAHRDESVNRDERIGQAITSVVAEGVIREKRDFAIVYRLIVDCAIREGLTIIDFAHFLQTKCKIPSPLLPSASSLSKVVIQGRYPKWKFVDVKPEVSEHFWLVAKTFLGGWYKISNHPKKYATFTAVIESEKWCV